MTSQKRNDYEQAASEVGTPRPNEFGRAALVGNKAIIEPTQEQLSLLASSVELASAITEQYPQVDEDGKLNYAIAGSLSVMLVAQANRFAMLDDDQDSRLQVVREVAIPNQSSAILKTFARHLGDFDYAETDTYRAKKDAAMGIDYQTDPEGWQAARAQYLFKGGTTLGNFSKSSRDLMQLPEDSILFAEAVGSVTSQQAVRLEAGGKGFIIIDPRIIVAFKTVHLLESFDTTSKPQKYINDFSILREGLKAIYPDEELLKITHDTLMGYAGDNPNGLEVPYHNPGLTQDIKVFIDAAIQIDKDAPYLEALEIGRERAVGILKILHRFKIPQAKVQIIDFINKHKEAVDKWDVNGNSERTIDAIAEYLDINQEFRDKLIASYGSNETEDLAQNGTAYWLRHSAYFGVGINDTLNAMEDHSQLDRRPVRSEYLDLLMHLDEADLSRQLTIVGQLIERKAASKDHDLLWVFESDALQDTGTKQSVISGLEHAVEDFDDERLRAFVTALSIKAVQSFDENLDDLSVAGKIKLMAKTLEEFGLTG